MDKGIYNHRQIEKRWRAAWEERPVNVYREDAPKFYCLDMFPYPSDKGLHVGHWRGYVLSDVLARHKILQGHYVLHPMGWDAFGLPAENYAIKNNVHPNEAVDLSIAAFKRQLKEMSAVYDWERELSTTDPDFYRWTQWIFLQMYKKGLAYEKEMPLNWCGDCKIVLANEEAAGGECERCGGAVTKRNLRQWMLRITDYAERLLADLADLDWPEKVKKMQAEWIGKSYGAHIDFAIDGHAEKMTVFTTRPDTLFGATFMVLAPEHPLVAKLTTPENRAAVDEYVYEASMKSNVDRMAKKDKTGIFIGAHAINPGNGEKIQIWISDYVLADYGTGCIMCVPGHDERDHEFALKFGLPIVQVVDDNGVMINSPGFDGMDFEAGKTAITAMLAAKGLGEQTTNYKLRDWVFSRQRYWGEPIPLIHCEFCGTVPVPEADLPVILPHVASYQPTDTGESPLALISDWVNVPCPACGTDAKRETNTMPQWAGSSWYFLRYADPKNNDALISEKAASTWLPVDYYVGGVEHAVLHLLYARFYTKFLYDIGVVKFEEPFKKLFNQGMICRHGVKMSKSKGNGVSPDELIESYGCDSLRLYLLFIGPPEQDADWDDRGIEGCYRFLSRVWRLVNEGKNAAETRELKQIRHKLIFDVSNRLGQLSLNTVISAFMEQTNKLADIARVGAGVDKATLETLVILLSPFAPHIAEELWEVLGHKDSVFAQSWPEYDPEMLKSDSMTIVVQINGKVRENIHLAADMQKEDVIAAAKESIAARLADSQLVKEIYVPGKLVNFVIKS